MVSAVEISRHNYISSMLTAYIAHRAPVNQELPDFFLTFCHVVWQYSPSSSCSDHVRGSRGVKPIGDRHHLTARLRHLKIRNVVCISPFWTRSYIHAGSCINLSIRLSDLRHQSRRMILAGNVFITNPLNLTILVIKTLPARVSVIVCIWTKATKPDRG